MANHVILEFGHGHDGAGKYDLGHVVPFVGTELDLIDSYGIALQEGLENQRIRITPLQTRKKPGLSEIERCEGVGKDYFVISLHMGTSQQKIVKQRGCVFTAAKHMNPFAVIAAQVIERWGKSTTPHFEGVTVGAAKTPLLESSKNAVLLEPFCMDGSDAVLLAARLPRLGEMLADELGAYIAVAHKGAQAPVNIAPERRILAKRA